MTAVRSVEEVRALLDDVHDPEIPMLSIADLGILRDVSLDHDRVVVTITPTYSGCPAMDEIRSDITTTLERAGHDDVDVRTSLSPAWTTDWMTEQGRRTLQDNGIAPPTARRDGPVAVTIGRRPRPSEQSPACPQCGSADTEEIAHFGSTSCKALWRCRRCREPFDHFKRH